ncbi:MAG: hypothetical protein KIT40_15650 [Nitrospira sp.]|nr:hypothetical protein [Nitrospira sp.]
MDTLTRVSMRNTPFSHVSLILTIGLMPFLSGYTFHVNSVTDLPDSNPGDHICEGVGTGGGCTLRAAIMESISTRGIDTIDVPSGLYILDPSRGPLVITDEVKIEGSSPASTVIEGWDKTRSTQILRVTQGGYLVANNLTLQRGEAYAGGGIEVLDGGAELNNVVIRDNSSVHGGGGIYIAERGTVRMWRSNVLSNSGGNFGGGILNAGDLGVFESTIANNRANRAGGIQNDGRLNLRNSTISGNVVLSTLAGTGGIYQNNVAVLNNVTITDNSGFGNNPDNRGGGLHVVSGTLTVITNSIIAGNHGNGGPNDCDGALSVGSKYNLIQNPNGCTIPSQGAETFRLNVDPRLAPLADNGGPTQTHLPQPIPSPPTIFDPTAHRFTVVTGCETHDQRGVTRSSSTGPCDMGAVEMTRADFSITRFILVNAASDKDIRPLRQGDSLVLDQLPPQLSIRAEIVGSLDGIDFDYDGVRTSNTNVPYSLGGDTAGDYAPFSFTTGYHRLTATPYASTRGRRIEGVELMLDFTVQHTEGASNTWETRHIEIMKPAHNLTLVDPTTPKLVLNQNNATNLLIRTDEGTSHQREVTGLMSTNLSTLMADLGVPVGTHTVTAHGDVPCWYCTGGTRHVRASHTFTLLPAVAPCTRTDGNLVRTIPASGITVGQQPGRQTIATPLLNGTDSVLITIDDAPDLQQNQIRVELDLNPDQGVDWNKAIEAWGACRTGSRVALAEASMQGGFGVGVICTPLSDRNDFRSGCTKTQTILLNRNTTGELLLRKPGFAGIWQDVEVFDSSIWAAWGGRSVRFIWWSD